MTQLEFEPGAPKAMFVPQHACALLDFLFNVLNRSEALMEIVGLFPPKWRVSEPPPPSLRKVLHRDAL